MSFEIIDCEQGSDEWHQARLGKITASVADKIVTKTGKPSSQMDEVINRAVAELVLGEPDETFVSDAMQRGKDLEKQALQFFNFTNGFEFESVGFLDSLKGYGCSPDGLNPKQQIGLELKVPLAHTHLGYLVGDALPDKYKMQVQHSLMLTDYDKWIFGSYHPELPCLCVEVGRDEKIIKALRENVEECAAEIQRRLAKIKELMGLSKEAG